ncbi:hypothetical protein RhiirA5_447758 [Rhizophagus irregularis]|uniref:Uncharacterized protein n=1 Tax=Rhizophagus irregularis TaxID=588596 RepID=A0A2N0NAY3_9GLOM|nr:hypothetical protein RhiirA5_447758 [Rhizophagus irregularis]
MSGNQHSHRNFWDVYCLLECIKLERTFSPNMFAVFVDQKKASNLVGIKI